MPPSIDGPAAGASGDERRWFSFVRAFMLACFSTLAVLLTLIFLIDPFDSGRSPVSIVTGTADKDSRFANASHGRNPAYNAAIIGNSHAQIIHPERLSALSGLKFVQMSVAGTKPREQLVLAKWFMRHHTPPAARTVVLVVDDWWCTHDPALPVLYDFPFWLYEGGWFQYLPKLLSTQSFDRATRRVALALGMTKVVGESAFNDYEIGTTWSFNPTPVPQTPIEPPFDGAKLSKQFPAIEQLRAVLTKELGGVPVIVVMPYVHESALPRAGSERAAEFANCKATLTDAIAAQSSARFVDLYGDGPVSRDPQNFMDATHYRKNVAIIIEAKIADALAALEETSAANRF